MCKESLILKSKWIVLIISIMVVLIIPFFCSYSIAQEQDLQGLRRSSPSSPSSLSPTTTTGPGISINNSLLISDANNATTTQSLIQDRVMVGSFGDDRITGSNESDIIIGLLGADTIRGGSGDDKIQGNEDIDRLYGEDGNDLLQGGAATDQLYGGQGDDILSGGMGDNFLVGEQGNDKLYGGSEDDDILAIKC